MLRLLWLGIRNGRMLVAGRGLSRMITNVERTGLETLVAHMKTPPATLSILGILALSPIVQITNRLVLRGVLAASRWQLHVRARFALREVLLHVRLFALFLSFWMFGHGTTASRSMACFDHRNQTELDLGVIHASLEMHLHPRSPIRSLSQFTRVKSERRLNNALSASPAAN